jgi:hypothetical protein
MMITDEPLEMCMQNVVQNYIEHNPTNSIEKFFISQQYKKYACIEKLFFILRKVLSCNEYLSHLEVCQ